MGKPGRAAEDERGRGRGREGKQRERRGTGFVCFFAVEGAREAISSCEGRQREDRGQAWQSNSSPCTHPEQRVGQLARALFLFLLVVVGSGKSSFPARKCVRSSERTQCLLFVGLLEKRSEQ